MAQVFKGYGCAFSSPSSQEAAAAPPSVSGTSLSRRTCHSCSRRPGGCGLSEEKLSRHSAESQDDQSASASSETSVGNAMLSGAALACCPGPSSAPCCDSPCDELGQSAMASRTREKPGKLAADRLFPASPGSPGGPLYPGRRPPRIPWPLRDTHKSDVRNW
eukprot:CAMPEP_0181504340 /NCGR_PEP_ID=MMETSP1110-20121109/57453_1 /TAXON_ID=174948 /ORGANISM="Symbiodinium sp., Strain CCMP421" /LENGTH=161 /DNA_ID=CAMNT_0023633213 /DNA_START=166 /DNA_END=651 /DNA_ORIENTATION=-